MQNWVAVSLLVGQAVLLLMGSRVVRRFGDFMDVVVDTHRQNLKIRENLAIQENDLAVRHLHRRHDDPLPIDEEKEA